MGYRFWHTITARVEPVHLNLVDLCRYGTQTTLSKLNTIKRGSVFMPHRDWVCIRSILEIYRQSHSITRLWWCHSITRLWWLMMWSLWLHSWSPVHDDNGPSLGPGPILGLAWGLGLAYVTFYVSTFCPRWSTMNRIYWSCIMGRVGGICVSPHPCHPFFLLYNDLPMAFVIL